MDSMQETDDSYCSAVQVLCEELRQAAMLIPESRRSTIQEIRLRAGKPLCFTDGTTTLFTDSSGRMLYSMSDNALTVTQRQLGDTFRRLCSYSVYSCQNELKNGYITIKGGHRAGVCGTAVLENGCLNTVTDISSINLRIARQVPGAAREIISRLYPFSGGVLIAGVPSSGKTTILRDLARSLSLGIGCRIMRTSVIDERGELSGTYSGRAYNDLGLCDVFNGYPKGEGILQALRAMSPQVIICDELGSEEDCLLAEQGFNAGAVMIATIHASSYQELLRRRQARRLIDTGAFRTVVILGSADRPCEIAGMTEIE